MADLTDAELREYLLLEVATTKFYKASHTVGPAAASEVLRLRGWLKGILKIAPKEIVYDEFVYERMVESYREAARKALNGD